MEAFTRCIVTIPPLDTIASTSSMTSKKTSFWLYFTPDLRHGVSDVAPYGIGMTMCIVAESKDARTLTKGSSNNDHGIGIGILALTLVVEGRSVPGRVVWTTVAPCW